MATNPYVNKVVFGERTVIDISPTTAVEADVAQGKIFYKASGAQAVGTNSGGSSDGAVTQDQDGYLVLSDEPGTNIDVEPLSVTTNGTYTAPTGTAYSPVTVNVSGGSTTLKMGVIRPDAELVQKWSMDALLIEDLGVTLPAFTTSTTTVRPAQEYSPNYTFEDGYYYFLQQRTLTIPLYNVANIAKGRQEYYASAAADEYVNLNMQEITTIGGGKPTYNDYFRSSGRPQIGLTVYWTGATTPNSTTTAYGIYAQVSGTTISNKVLTMKQPIVYLRGDSGYLNQAYYSYISDVRVQHIAELYRVPKNNMGVNGWNSNSQILSVLNDISNNNGDLT